MHEAIQPASRLFGAFTILADAMPRALGNLQNAWRVRQAAAQIRAFSDYELKDMGLTRCEIDYKLRHPNER